MRQKYSKYIINPGVISTGGRNILRLVTRLCMVYKISASREMK